MARQRPLWLVIIISFLWTVAACCEGPIPSGRRSAIVQVVEKAKTAIVNIQSERVTYGQGAAGQSTVLNRANGMGTGILIDPRGYIVTNHHVVDDVSSLKVRTCDGTQYAAQVVCKDKEKDLAVIKIAGPQPFPTMTLGTSSDLMMGETVIAIGNAFGYEHTVSVGIVSHLHRDVTLSREVSYKALIQTDASINPGNSGGPLLNIDGELIGVNVAIRAGAQNISFALPIDQVIQGVSEMLAKKRGTDMPIGFCYKDQINRNRQPLHALQVEKVGENSPAARAGLNAGDRIVQIGDTPVRCGMDLERALCERRPNERLSLKVLRGGREVDLDWQLQTFTDTTSAVDKAWQQFGIKLTAGQGSSQGLFVAEVRVGGSGDQAGIRPGDSLAGLHVWEVTSLEHLGFVLNHADFKSFFPLKFHVYRDGQLHRGVISGP